MPHLACHFLGREAETLFLEDFRSHFLLVLCGAGKEITSPLSLSAIIWDMSQVSDDYPASVQRGSRMRSACPAVKPQLGAHSDNAGAAERRRIQAGLHSPASLDPGTGKCPIIKSQQLQYL